VRAPDEVAVPMDVESDAATVEAPVTSKLISEDTVAVEFRLALYSPTRADEPVSTVTCGPMVARSANVCEVVVCEAAT
jgi:hypothetical protein